MSSFWESKYLNSEKSIQFLQATHSEILRGLHDEIENLQKQCSDYALRLSMRAATALEKEEYDQKFKSFNSEYKKKDALIQEQKKLVEERNRNLKSLQERVKQLEAKFETEASVKDSTIKQLKKQVEAQSDQIAQLTYQMHQNNKTKSNDKQNMEQFLVNNNDARLLLAQPVSSKKNKTITKNEFNDRSIEYDPTGLQASFIRSNNRRSSAQSLKSDVSSEDQQQQHEGATGSSLDTMLLNQPKRSNSSNSNNPNNSVLLTDRSSTPPLYKVLPPVIKRLSENVPPPDPKPFLQSAASTLHSRARKDLLQRRTLISLPPINKSFELNHLAVESPHKSVHNNNSNKMVNEHNNSSAN